jgi:hypothetical protein
MGDGSPLFHSALDLLAHACEHYAIDSERDRRFVVLHLANAIELLLKDRLLDLGISIYQDRNPKLTKSINKVFSDLEEANVQIPQRPIIELLIDDRNTLQHRFGSPNSIMVKYYVDNTLRFFRDFMNAAFGLELREYLSNLLDRSTFAYIYPVSETSKDILLQARSVARIHPSSSILTAWMELEKKVNKLRQSLEKQSKTEEEWFRFPASSFLRHLLGDYMTRTSETERLRREIIHLSVMRNNVVHTRTDATAEDAENYIQEVEQVLPKIEALESQILEQMKLKTKASTKRKSKTAK